MIDNPSRVMDDHFTTFHGKKHRAENSVATSTTPETINGKTIRHSVGIQQAHMAATDAAINLLSASPDAIAVAEPILAAFNQLSDHSRDLIDFQATQIRYLEALCRNMEAKAEARS